MKIQITNKLTAVKMCYKFSIPTAIISIRNSNKSPVVFPRNPNIKGIIKCYFDDIQFPVDGYTIFNSNEASRIIKWIKQVEPYVEQIIIHCEAGISRSSAIAKFTCDYFGQCKEWITNSNKYIPNEYVYNVINGVD